MVGGVGEGGLTNLPQTKFLAIAGANKHFAPLLVLRDVSLSSCLVEAEQHTQSSRIFAKHCVGMCNGVINGHPV